MTFELDALLLAHLLHEFNESHFGMGLHVLHHLGDRLSRNECKSLGILLVAEFKSIFVVFSPEVENFSELFVLSLLHELSVLFGLSSELVGHHEGSSSTFGDRAFRSLTLST